MAFELNGDTVTFIDKNGSKVKPYWDYGSYTAQRADGTTYPKFYPNKMVLGFPGYGEFLVQIIRNDADEYSLRISEKTGRDQTKQIHSEDVWDPETGKLRAVAFLDELLTSPLPYSN